VSMGPRDRRGIANASFLDLLRAFERLGLTRLCCYIEIML
jgi:hypothetical protein